MAEKNEEYLARVKEIELNFLHRESRVPLEQIPHTPLTPETVDVDNFVRLKKVFDGVKRFVDEGHNLYIFSQNFGNGKTTWAKNILVHYMDEVALGNQFRVCAVFVNVSDLLYMAKESIGKENGFDDLVDKIRNAKLVVWDDISSNKLTEYEHRLLFPIIDARLQSKKSNIYTSNVSGDGLIKNLGQRLTSRVWNTSMVVELKGKDRRGLNDTIADFE